MVLAIQKLSGPRPICGRYNCLYQLIQVSGDKNKMFLRTSLLNKDFDGLLIGFIGIIKETIYLRKHRLSALRNL